MLCVAEGEGVYFERPGAPRTPVQGSADPGMEREPVWRRGPSVPLEQLTDPVARCGGCDGLAPRVEISAAGALCE